MKNNDKKNFSKLCVEICGGRCCNPWWGIIYYTLRTTASPSKLTTLHQDILNSIKKREKRIRSAYVTNEKPPRPLFEKPLRYNITPVNIKVDGGGLLIEMRAMFAFRCLFLSEENVCTIHPSLDKSSEDIRPPHCAELGMPTARSGEKGYCRIIEAEVLDGGAGLEQAIEIEKLSSEEHFSSGLSSVEGATDKVVLQVKDFFAIHPEKLPKEVSRKQSRNEPCACGSGKKYKKCCGS